MKIKSFVYGIGSAFLVTLSACTTAPAPKNVILFIGDGMAGPQRAMADDFSRKTGRGPLAMNVLPFAATTTTHSANSAVTDSAAAVTAIACGVKTKNATLGVDPNGDPLVTCAEVAKDEDKKVGVCTTVTITHATPAGFYAHRKNRHDQKGVVADLVKSDFDFFAGGGKAACAAASTSGYHIVKTRADFLKLKPGCGKILTGFTSGNLDYVIDYKPDSKQPTLAEITAKAIELLDNSDGFFLMVEGGLVDWACHANDAAISLREILAMDDAVRVALEFQKKSPETLVIVTGDHETGGLSVATNDALRTECLAHQTMPADTFQSQVKKLVKANPKLTFADVKPVIKKAFGFVFSDEAGDAQNLMRLTKKEEDSLKEAFQHDLELHRHNIGENPDYTGVRRYLLGGVCRHLISTKSGLKWVSNDHTAAPVLTTAKGPGAERFTGTIDNTDIAKIIKSLLD